MHFTNAIDASPNALLVHRLPTVVEVTRSAVLMEGVQAM